MMSLISTQRVYAMDIWTKATEIMEDTSSGIPAAVTGLLVFADYTCRCDKKKILERERSTRQTKSRNHNSYGFYVPERIRTAGLPLRS